MPAVGSALGALIQTNVNSKMSALTFGAQPLAQVNPTYFIAFCNAIGNGIATGSPTIDFTTNDDGFTSSPLVPAGVGAGVGIVVDDAFFAQDLYTRTRSAIITQYGSSSHDPYPPAPTNSGALLKALCEGIALSVKTHYSSAWILTSEHPTIYSGTGEIVNGNFSGLSASTVKGAIQAAGPTMQGTFWPTLAQAISESYVDAIHNHSTGMVTITGTCVVSVIPLQLCNIPATATDGTGTAA